MSFEQRLLRALRLFLFFGVILVGVVLWFVQWWLTHPKKQPIAFSHEIHVGQRQISCFYCHTGALSGDIAGVPSVQDCMQCHQVVAADHPEIKKLTGYWERKEPINWFKVYKMPKTVMFSHRVHIAFLAKSNPKALDDPGTFICARCHGDVSKMSSIAAPTGIVKMMTGNMNPNTGMGFCIDCHRTNGGPIDCTACHR